MKENTVFILGAGASMPYGFPSGLELKKLIVLFLIEYIRKQGDKALVNTINSDFVIFEEEIKNKLLKNFKGGSNIEKVTLREKNISKFINELTSFKNFEIIDNMRLVKRDISFMYRFLYDFIFSGTNSIDAFLTQNREYINFGKTILTLIIFYFECHSNVFSFEENWYNYFFNHILNRNIDSISKSRCSFVTFNYDRSFQFYLFKAFNSLNKLDVEKFENQIEIIPVYGNLGAKRYSFDCYGKYGDSFSAENLSLIREDEVYTENQVKAREVISNAKQIVFLGFGFDDANMKLLFEGSDLWNAKENQDFGKLKVDVVYTSFGLTNSEIIRLKNKYRFLDNIRTDFKQIGNTVILENVFHHAETNPKWTNYDLLRNSTLFQTFLE